MNTNQQTVETIHGSIDYDTETCANCNQETLTEDSIAIGIGYEANDDGDIGVNAERSLCPSCARSLFDYDGPSSSLSEASIAQMTSEEWSEIAFIVFMAAMPIGFLTMMALIGV